MVRDFQSVIGSEARAQVLERVGQLPADGGGLRGGWVQRDGDLQRISAGRDVELVGVEAAGEGIDTSPAQRDALGWAPRRAARLAVLPAAGCGWAGCAGAFGVGGPRLSRRRSGAQLAARYGPGGVPRGRRSRGARCVPAILATGRHHSGARDGARDCLDRSESTRPVGQPTTLCLLCLSGRGDKDVAHVAALLGGTGVSSPPAPAATELDVRVDRGAAA